jgi:hypothetical protein
VVKKLVEYTRKQTDGAIDEKVDGMDMWVENELPHSC